MLAGTVSSYYYHWGPSWDGFCMFFSTHQLNKCDTILLFITCTCMLCQCYINLVFYPYIYRDQMSAQKCFDATVSLTTYINYVPPPPNPWDVGEHIDLLYFPVTQIWVGNCVCARLCVRDISYVCLLMAFKFSDMVTLDKTLNWLTFCEICSIFKVTGGHYVSKFTLF